MAGSSRGWPGSPIGMPPTGPTFGLPNKYRLTKAEVRMLMQLCHPDKHDNSELSKKAFEFLRSYDAAA